MGNNCTGGPSKNVISRTTLEEERRNKIQLKIVEALAKRRK
jgi:hypothetical protein